MERRRITWSVYSSGRRRTLFRQFSLLFYATASLSLGQFYPKGPILIVDKRISECATVCNFSILNYVVSMCDNINLCFRDWQHFCPLIILSLSVTDAIFESQGGTTNNNYQATINTAKQPPRQLPLPHTVAKVVTCPTTEAASWITIILLSHFATLSGGLERQKSSPLG